MTTAAGTVVDFAAPALGPEEIAAAVAALESGWLSSGPRAREFERGFASYVGSPHAVAVNSYPAALHLVRLAHVGATPRFADVDCSYVRRIR